MNQEEFGQALGRKKGAVSNYEAGISDPETSALAVIAEMGGVTLDWLITGEERCGHVHEQGDLYGEPPPLEADLLADAIAKTEEMLIELNLKDVSPQVKAKVIQGLYEMAIHQGHKISKSTVRAMLRLVA